MAYKKTTNGGLVRNTETSTSVREPKPNLAASLVRDAVLAMCPDDAALKVVWNEWRDYQDDRARLKAMAAIIFDGLSYGNWPWATDKERTGGAKESKPEGNT